MKPRRDWKTKYVGRIGDDLAVRVYITIEAYKCVLNVALNIYAKE